MLLGTPTFFLLLIPKFSIISAYQDEVSKSITVPELRHHIMLSHHKDLLCIIIKGKDESTNISEAEDVLEKQEYKNIYKGVVSYSLELMKVTNVSDESKLPSLRCFFASPQFEDFGGIWQYNFVSNWIKRMVKKNKRLMSLNLSNVQESLTESEVTVLALPFLERVIDFVRVIRKVKIKLKNHCSLSTILIHPNSRHQRNIKTFYDIPDSSSIAIFIKTVGKKEVKKKIFTGQSIHSVQISSYILACLSGLKHLTVKNFQLEALTVKTTEKYQPFIIGFYAWWAQQSDSFLASFKSAVNGFKENSVLAKFALVNVADEKAVIPAFIKMRKFKALPYTVLFQREKGKYTVNQTILSVDHPTTFYLYKNLLSHGVHLEDYWGKPWVYSPYKVLDFLQYSDIREGPFGHMCTAWAHNQTDSLFIPTPKPLDNSTDLPKPKTIEDLLPKHNGVPVMTGNFWDASVKKSTSNLKLYTSTSKVVLTVFGFIQSGCSSCESKLNVFKELHREVGKAGYSQFLLVNCSKDISLCNELSINGFPSVVAFRNFAALATSRCGIPHHEKPYARREYHGPIDTWNILSWCDQLVKSSTELLGFNNLPPFSASGNDVRLVATLIPKYSVYLPVAPGRDRNYFYSLSCFRLVCELLYGLASCHMVYSKNVPHSEFKSTAAMVVTEIDFERKDEISMKLVSLGKPLQSLFKKETGSNLHLFHRPHQYSMSPTQTCESNHQDCSQIIVNFTRDHLRLPVTMLTSEIFHTKNNPLFEEGKPVLIALGFPENITASSSFMQVMYQVASTFYKDLLVTVINVMDYPAWAGSFVPKNYNKYYIAEDDSGPLHNYPRLCLVDWTDHSHAAFYPPLYTVMEGTRQTFNISMENIRHLPLGEEFYLSEEDIWKEESLIQYIRQYLQDPSLFVVKTEYF